ncbi:hypothetical protein C8A03DRAFT_44235 [Achaetomium macrosporum]|uniref:Amidase domain-containing protein n=1 Tax=Achaetomium macrosporum TaxID=79813 RepID=A0AAN7HF77_9PEZI|nr:hypothetical protein C8A03DRAFT_44235 [Achaetomium macrosporum]
MESVDDNFFVRRSVRYAALGAIAFEPQPWAGGPVAHSLVTVVAAEEGVALTLEWLDERLHKMEKDCDVYRRDLFFDGMVIINPKLAPMTTAPSCLLEVGAEWLEIRSGKDVEDRPPPGPYLYANRALKPVYRLYDDTRGAFLIALRPKASGIAVPARSPEKLNQSCQRLRVVVKDVFRIKRLKTSVINRAYYEINEPAKSTAWVIETLAYDGAHILGMTKLSSMIGREEPLDAVDFHTAFNPRGDGYQSPAGSSSGSAAAVAAYEWIDCGIGTDTSGSGRRPALVNDPGDMVPTYSPFDTPCIFSRELRHLKSALNSWLPHSDDGDLANYSIEAELLSYERDGERALGTHRMEVKEPSYEIVYLLDYLPVANKEQMALIQGFLIDIVAHFPATIRKMSIRETWKLNHPEGTSDDVDEYLGDVIKHTYDHGFYHSSDGFRKAYAEAHDGRTPYVIPFVQRRWAKGVAVTPAQQQEAADKLKVYRDWLMRMIFYHDSPEARQKQVFVLLPISNVAPNYRDTPSASTEEQSALDELFLPPILGAPDIAVPIGDVPYQSRITGQTEHLPVVADLMAAPGKDLELMTAVEKILALSGRPTVLKTWKRMFA